jgi:Flp pilus assembly protein TadG
MINILKLRRTGERGQGFMELAISLVFLLILLSVVIELGWAFYEMIALRDAAQEAASYAAMCPPAAGDTIDPPTGNVALIWDRLRLSATTPLDTDDLDYNGVTIEMLDATSGLPVTTPELGNTIRIEVTYGHKIKAPFVGSFLGRYEYDLVVDVSDTIMREECN